MLRYIPKSSLLTFDNKLAFYVVAIAIAANLITMFFSMPETKYTGTRPTTQLASPEKDFKTSGHVECTDIMDRGKVPSSVPETAIVTPKRPYISELAFWGHGDPDVNLLHAFLRPFPLVVYPTVLWSCVIYGLALGWNVILGASVAQLFAPA